MDKSLTHSGLSLLTVQGIVTALGSVALGEHSGSALGWAGSWGRAGRYPRLAHLTVWGVVKSEVTQLLVGRRDVCLSLADLRPREQAAQPRALRGTGQGRRPGSRLACRAPPRGHVRRRTVDSERAAAWGERASVLPRCGLRPPEDAGRGLQRQKAGRHHLRAPSRACSPEGPGPLLLTGAVCVPVCRPWVAVPHRTKPAARPVHGGCAAERGWGQVCVPQSRPPRAASA